MQSLICLTVDFDAANYGAYCFTFELIHNKFCWTGFLSKVLYVFYLNFLNGLSVYKKHPKR